MGGLYGIEAERMKKVLSRARQATPVMANPFNLNASQIDEDAIARFLSGAVEENLESVPGIGAQP